VPASRTGYAYVYVNGEDYGIHLDIEALDEIALAKLFGSFDEGVQHLYEGKTAPTSGRVALATSRSTREATTTAISMR
jgi:CotH kinase protein